MQEEKTDLPSWMGTSYELWTVVPRRPEPATDFTGEVITPPDSVPPDTSRRSVVLSLLPRQSFQDWEKTKLSSRTCNHPIVQLTRP